jgi:hypothetical protein
VYAPALVAFVGVGGVGMAAWFPLGPGEVYRPGPNVRYVNQGVVGAVTVVPHDAFVEARPVARAMVIVPQREIVQAQVVGSTARIAPVRESVLGHPAGAAAVRTPPARFVDRVARPAVAPVRNDRPPAANPVARPAGPPQAEQPKPAAKKPAKKTEKKQEPKDIR